MGKIFAQDTLLSISFASARDRVKRCFKNPFTFRYLYPVQYFVMKCKSTVIRGDAVSLISSFA